MDLHCTFVPEAMFKSTRSEYYQYIHCFADTFASVYPSSNINNSLSSSNRSISFNSCLYALRLRLRIGEIGAFWSHITFIIQYLLFMTHSAENVRWYSVKTVHKSSNMAHIDISDRSKAQICTAQIRVGWNCEQGQLCFTWNAVECNAVSKGPASVWDVC